jgi:hypothetical protein
MSKLRLASLISWVIVIIGIVLVFKSVFDIGYIVIGIGIVAAIVIRVLRFLYLR